MLIVEISMKELSVIDNSLTECEKEIESTHYLAKLEELRKKIQCKQGEFCELLKDFKLQKFQRDTMSYLENKVCRWMSGTRHKHHYNPRGTQFRQLSESNESNSSMSFVATFSSAASESKKCFFQNQFKDQNV